MRAEDYIGALLLGFFISLLVYVVLMIGCALALLCHFTDEYPMYGWPLIAAGASWAAVSGTILVMDIALDRVL